MNAARRSIITLAAGFLALAAGLLTPMAAQAAESAPAPAAASTVSTTAQLPARDAVTGEALRAWACTSGHVCFWTGRDGTGSRCMWEVADPDWAGGAVRCSWALTTNVKSVFNAGTSSATGVVYYSGTNYSGRLGCTRQQHGGNLAGTYRVRSHQWTSGRCG